MATSGSTDFSVTTQDIIKDALIEIGALPANGTPTNDDYQDALRKLNRMVKYWQSVQGYNIFRRARGSFTVTAGKGTDENPFTLGGSSPDFASRPIRIENVRFKPTSGSEIPMMKLSRAEYDLQPNKSATGQPTGYHFNAQESQAEMFVWPVPGTANGGSIIFTYQRTIEDFDNTSDNPDFPQEWYEALVLSLAARLHPTFFPSDKAGTAELQRRASSVLMTVASFDQDQGDLILTRDG